MSIESDYSGRIDEFYKNRADSLSVFDVKPQIGFDRFAETFNLHDFVAVFPYTDYAGFHATDVNWYEEGNYRTGLMRVNLFHHLERLFRDGKFLEEDQELTPICHFSENPGEALLFPFLIQEAIPRPNLVIDVTGGEHDSWGQFICCNLGERRFFEMVDDREYVSEAFNRWDGSVG